MKFPKSDTYKFKKYEMTLKFPFVLYYEWECFIVPINNDDEGEGKNKNYLLTKKTALLDPSGYSIALIGPRDFLYTQVYNGPHPIDHFISHAIFILLTFMIKGLDTHTLEDAFTCLLGCYPEPEFHVVANDEIRRGIDFSKKSTMTIIQNVDNRAYEGTH